MTDTSRTRASAPKLDPCGYHQIMTMSYRIALAIRHVPMFWSVLKSRSPNIASMFVTPGCTCPVLGSNTTQASCVYFQCDNMGEVDAAEWCFTAALAKSNQTGRQQRSTTKFGHSTGGQKLNPVVGGCTVDKYRNSELCLPIWGFLGLNATG